MQEREEKKKQGEGHEEKMQPGQSSASGSGATDGERTGRIMVDTQTAGKKRKWQLAQRIFQECKKNEKEAAKRADEANLQWEISQVVLGKARNYEREQAALFNTALLLASYGSGRSTFQEQDNEKEESQDRMDGSMGGGVEGMGSDGLGSTKGMRDNNKDDDAPKEGEEGEESEQGDGEQDEEVSVHSSRSDESVKRMVEEVMSRPR